MLGRRELFWIWGFPRSYYLRFDAPPGDGDGKGRQGIALCHVDLLRLALDRSGVGLYGGVHIEVGGLSLG